MYNHFRYKLQFSSHSPKIEISAKKLSTPNRYRKQSIDTPKHITIDHKNSITQKAHLIDY